MLTRILLMAFLMGLLLPARGLRAAEDKKVREQYQKLLTDADLEKHPEHNQQLAAWCLGHGLKAEGEKHDLDYRRSQFEIERRRLPENAGAADLKRVLDAAARLKLDAEQQSAHAAWLQAELKERRAKLKADDAAGLKGLLAFATKENAGPPEQDLAQAILKLDPQFEAAHLALRHIKVGAEWIDPWDLLVKKGGLADWRVRVDIYKQMEAARKPEARVYSKTPLAGVPKKTPKNFFEDCVWRDSIRKGDGKGQMYILQPPGYDPSKSWPLILSLHGGGSGGAEVAEEQASWAAAEYSNTGKDCHHVVVAPLARNHVINSWNTKEDMLDAIDAIRDACERFNIDRKRIYVTGASMGGQGTSRFSWTVPELFAGFSPRAGAYWNDFKVPNLAGKSYLVFHGDKDEGFRNETLKVFLDKLKQASADVEYVNFPDAGHILDNAVVCPRTIKFFESHTNEVTPDLDMERKIIEETVTEKPIEH